MKNTTKYYGMNVLWNIVLLTTVGAVVQTFLLEIGCSEAFTNVYFSLMQMVQIGVILVFSPLSDSLKNVIRAHAHGHWLAMPFVLLLLLISCCSVSYSPLVFAGLVATGILFYASIGISNVLSYKLPYSIMDMETYGRMIAISGLLSGAVGFGASALLSALQMAFSYRLVMTLAFGATALILLVCIGCMYSLRATHARPTKQVTARRLNYFTYQPFSRLILPNLTRGFCVGVVAMAVTIGYYFDCLDSRSASVLVILNAVVAAVGSALYPRLSVKIGERRLLLISSVLVFVFLPLMLVWKSTVLFLIFYTVTNFLVNVINYAVPVAVTKIADYEVMGQYSGGRMLLHTAGCTLAGFLCIPLFQLVGGVLTLLIAAAMQLFSGSIYYVYMRKHAIT